VLPGQNPGDRKLKDRVRTLELAVKSLAAHDRERVEALRMATAWMQALEDVLVAGDDALQETLHGRMRHHLAALREGSNGK